MPNKGVLRTGSTGSVVGAAREGMDGAGDGKQRLLVPRSRCLPRLMPGVRLQKISWDHLVVFSIWHETYYGISGYAEEACCCPNLEAHPLNKRVPCWDVSAPQMQ